MKSYIDFMNEISSDELYEALLAYGLFADKLPPFFSSISFFDYCKNKTQNFSGKQSEYIYYENMRNINIPRELGIPNPMSYERLCKCISDNWEEIKQHFSEKTSNQEYKVSRIHIRKMNGKPQLFEMNYSNWKIDGTPEPELLIGKKYIVNADISKCFPSIYTHSLTWALAGKKIAKQQRNGVWYNELDTRTQNIKDGETHGLLIGPHTSNILSEIILCTIDYVLVKKGWKYIRNIDDYTCYVETEDEAHQFLSELQAELRKYDLSLNHKKTAINPLPMAAVEQWVRKINSISLLTNYGKVDYKNCRAYMDFALEIAKSENRNSSVLKYAIKVLSGLDLTENAKRYEMQTVFHLCLIYPYLVPLLEEYIFKACTAPLQSIDRISQKIYDNGIQSGNFEMSSYALYFAIKYNFIIENINVATVRASEDCILMILAYVYYKKNRDRDALKNLRELAKDLSKNDFDRYWIFVYEVLPQSELHDDWKGLKKAKVTFIKDM